MENEAIEIDNIEQDKFKEEFNGIVDKLDHHHGIFYSLVGIGCPYFTKSIQTVAVAFDDAGNNIDFIFNPDFWNELDNYTRKFVICHECLHVLLNHGARSLGHDKQLANMCLDVVVNHMLVNKFNFERERIPIEKDLCWTDTVFGEEAEDIATNLSYEQYLNMAIGKLRKENYMNSIDNHDSLYQFNDKDVKKSIVERIKDQISHEEGESFVDAVQSDNPPSKGNSSNKGGEQAGSIAGNISVQVKQKAKKKKKWETVIKEWARKRISISEQEQWARTNRRLYSLDPDLMIPSDMETESYENEKIDVWFFQDTSGSCMGYHKRFFKAAQSLDPKRFNIHMFCFDTRVYETSLETGKLYGFGGTSFDILENYIQNKLNKEEIKRYPDAVFVITDGMGNRIHPEKPERWYWFLTNSHMTECIPEECNIFDLANFE